jgi:hypothetical protein
MSIGAGLVLIAVGAILRFGISTVSTHGFSIHTIGDILILVGILGVVLWLIIWAPWGYRRRTVYRSEPQRNVYRREVRRSAAPAARVSPDDPTYGDRPTFTPADRPVVTEYEEEYRD